MARRHWPWDVLGIERTSDKAAIRSAYAVKLKAMDVDADIQGYSALRSARDQALREADYAAEDQADDPLLDAEPDLLDDLDDSDVGEAGPGEWISIEEWDGDLDPGSFDPGPGRPWGNDFGYGTGDFADPETRVEHFEAQLSEDAPDRRLARLLYPNGAYSEEAFSHEEWQEARSALDELLADAKSGDLGREQSVDYWLGEILAESWPRSGPLVEQAAEAFDWVAQSGEIGERPALQFLNPRVRGMRFVTKVEQPGHPLYKAWEELKRPGKRGFLDRFRVRREDVETLLGGIRTRYPEVESYLDHERVKSWEKPAPSWVAWILQRLFIFFVVIQVLAFCSRTMGDDDAMPQVEVDRVVAEAFGPGRTMAEVEAIDSTLADRIKALIEFDRDHVNNLDALEDAVVVRMRELAALALEDAPKDDLLAIIAVRRDLFEVAREAGTPACAALLKTARLPEGAVVPESVREKERALTWRLAQAKLLDTNWTASEDKSLPLPDWVGPGIAQRTGLSVERINKVLQGEETPDLCAVRIALIDTLLSRPDDAPEELLRIM